MEKHQFVCDKDLRCPGREEGMEQLMAIIQFCLHHSGAPKYTAGLFKFCPWCGKEIIKEAERQASMKLTPAGREENKK